jgi:hypothetical protein
MTHDSHPTQAENEEHMRRRRRKEAYHLVAGKSRLSSDMDDLVSDPLYKLLTARQPNSTPEIQQAKAALVKELAVSGGDVTTPSFRSAVEELTNLYDPSHFDARVKTKRDNLANHLGGVWMMLSMPNFPGVLGRNSEGEYLYTLGHMSFDMFPPKDLVCSIQGSFNPVHYVGTRDREAIKHIPASLKDEVKKGKSLLRTYDLITAFTIEPRDATHDASANSNVTRPIKALMTTYGYALPDPNQSNRLSTWFRGGTIEVWDEELDMEAWRNVFGDLPTPPPKEKATVFRHKMKTGVCPANSMEVDGKLSYTLEKPFGGHGHAYADVIYLDETLRILRGNYGSLYVSARVPFPDE